MSDANDLGFRSTFVLMKIGHDLADILNNIIKTPIPEAFEAVTAEITDKYSSKNVVPLHNVRYVPHDDDPLF